jgi:hypothetical protein
MNLKLRLPCVLLFFWSAFLMAQTPEIIFCGTDQTSSSTAIPQGTNTFSASIDPYELAATRAT